VQNIRAVSFAFDGVLDGLDLATNPPNPIQHPLFVANDVGQASSSVR